MPLTAFMTICILGIDFMIYALFQWTYGDKRRALARKIDALRSQSETAAPRPFLLTRKARATADNPRSSAVWFPEAGLERGPNHNLSEQTS